MCLQPKYSDMGLGVSTKIISLIISGMCPWEKCSIGYIGLPNKYKNEYQKVFY